MPASAAAGLHQAAGQRQHGGGGQQAQRAQAGAAPRERVPGIELASHLLGGFTMTRIMCAGAVTAMCAAGKECVSARRRLSMPHQPALQREAGMRAAQVQPQQHAAVAVDDDGAVDARVGLAALARRRRVRSPRRRSGGRPPICGPDRHHLAAQARARQGVAGDDHLAGHAPARAPGRRAAGAASAGCRAGASSTLPARSWRHRPPGAGLELELHLVAAQRRHAQRPVRRPAGAARCGPRRPAGRPPPPAGSRPRAGGQIGRGVRAPLVRRGRAQAPRSGPSAAPGRRPPGRRAAWPAAPARTPSCPRPARGCCCRPVVDRVGDVGGALLHGVEFVVRCGRRSSRRIRPGRPPRGARRRRAWRSRPARLRRWRRPAAGAASARRGARAADHAAPIVRDARHAASMAVGRAHADPAAPCGAAGNRRRDAKWCIIDPVDMHKTVFL